MKLKKWISVILLACFLLTSTALAQGDLVSKGPDGTEDVVYSENVEDPSFEAVAFDLETGPDVSERISPEITPKISVPVTDFPDSKFRAWVTAHCDLNSDGILTDSETWAVTSISVPNCGIASLSGIEYFTCLETLDCSNNRLTALDLSRNANLTELNCGGNRIDWIDLGPCPEISKLVTTSRPVLSGGDLAFQKKVKKQTVTLVTLPADCAILVNGKTFFDPQSPLSLTASEIRLGVKDKLSLLPKECHWPSVYLSFSTSNKRYAKVSDEGLLTAVKAGSATITVTAFDGRSCACKVTVIKAPKKVTLSPATLTLGVGASETLAVTLPESTWSTLAWFSSNTAVASVDGAGKVTALKAGKATITVRTSNGKRDSCAVTVETPPASVSINPSKLTMLRGETATLTAVVPQGSAARAVWKSSNPKVVSVEAATGVVTALAEGRATVTATTYNGLSATCAITVTDGPKSIKTASSIKIGVGETFALDAVALRDDGTQIQQLLEYTSSNTKYATVSADGVVTGKKKGKATITVSASNGVKATCEVDVQKAPSSVKLSSSSLKLRRGESATLTVKLSSSSSASALTWSGYDSKIIQVDPATGQVTGLAPGSTTLTVSTFNNKKATCSIQVTLGPQDIADYRKTHPLIAVAHRGGRAYWPENTLEAFSHSASTGATMIELDVQTTSDGVQVIHHDTSFKAGGNTYKIPKKTYSTLKAAKPSLCTLDEALDTIYKTGLDIQLELKESADAGKCVEAIAKHGMKNRTWYISFKTKQLSKIRALDPDAKLGYIFEVSIPKDLNSTIASLRISALMVKQNLLTQDRINDWHMAGLLVNAWTCNTREDCKKFADMGVDFITSDYPDYAADLT